jgi:hypothetical protein
MTALLLGLTTTALSTSPQLAHAQKARSKEAAAAKGAKDEDGGKPRPMPISVSLLAGYGHTFNADDHLNPLGVGFGVRGGYNFSALYVGLRFMIFLGDSERVAAGVETSANAMTLGLELGYDVALWDDVLFVRPEIGSGLMIIEGESMVRGAMDTSVNGSSEDLYIAPGAALFVNVGRRSFLGLDLQMPIVFSDDVEVALTMLLIGGMRF